MNNWTSVLKALADESRLQIIYELLKQEATVKDLSEILDSQTYNISKHLKILEANKLVKKEENGRRRIYYVADNLKSRISNNNNVLDLGCCKFIFGKSMR
jgi:DNA-binding transcriptional ArsR family regulator